MANEPVDVEKLIQYIREDKWYTHEIITAVELLAKEKESWEDKAKGFSKAAIANGMDLLKFEGELKKVQEHLYGFHNCNCDSGDKEDG